MYLSAEIEKGLHSMIELLQRSKHAVKEETLLKDWQDIKRNYLQDALSGKKPN